MSELENQPMIFRPAFARERLFPMLEVLDCEPLRIRRRKIGQIYLYRRRNFRGILRGLRNISDTP